MLALCLTGLLALVAPAPEAPGPAGAIPAAPAAGFGAGSRGGDGGRTLWVTTLADAGPGSLREALLAPGPRVVRFRVGGVIRLESRILSRQGRVTLDGRDAAPLGGVTVASGGTRGAEGGVMWLEARDIIVRHVRFRGGYDPLSFVTCRRVLVDHVSLSQAVDENFGTWDSRDVTIQWSILAQGLVAGGHPKGEHSMGMILGGGSRRNTVHHNLFIANQDRNPLAYGPTRDTFWPRRYRYDIVNNLVADDDQGMKLRFEVSANVRANTFLPGPRTSPGRAAVHIHVDPGRRPRVYLEGNRGPGYEHPGGVLLGADERPWAYPRSGDPLPDWSRGVLREHPFPGPGPVPEPAAEAARRVVEESGAWPRDELDRRFLDEARSLLDRAGASPGALGP